MVQGGVRARRGCLVPFPRRELGGHASRSTSTLTSFPLNPTPHLTETIPRPYSLSHACPEAKGTWSPMRINRWTQGPRAAIREGSKASAASSTRTIRGREPISCDSRGEPGSLASLSRALSLSLFLSRSLSIALPHTHTHSPPLISVLRRARLSILSRGGPACLSRLSRGGPISRHSRSGHPTLNPCQPDSLPRPLTGANVGKSNVAPVALEPGPLHPKV